MGGASDILPYLEDVDLYYEWKRLMNISNCPFPDPNGIIQDLEELANLMTKALAELLKPIVEKI